ncbi:MAG: 16S rRNA (cytidine(1402)-2'-O)-methyltransferase [Candidatus Peregrinibacteria bacterium]
MPAVVFHHAICYGSPMLSIVSTPIGNLGDITLRAIETLKKCEGIICEDTRVTGQLLKLLNIEKKELISFHGHSAKEKANAILRRLKEGKHFALVSDAGTPGISDPGYAVVSQAREAGIALEVVPGPSAFLAALSASGLPINQFLYLGFLPIKKGRKTLLQSLKNEERTIVFYESVHRIERTLTELSDALKEQPNRTVVIARELTKMHEEIISTKACELPECSKKIVKKGEFVVVIGPIFL